MSSGNFETIPQAAFSSVQYSRAVLNILEDFAEEKDRLESTQKAFLNILEDFNEEKTRLEDTQRAVLNILDDLDKEKQRALKANRMKSEFLANMSHELRTPLNAIIGFTELMHNGKVGDVSDMHKEFLGDILTSSRHLLQLINDVLDLAKVESGKMEFSVESIHLPKLIATVVATLREVAAKKAITIQSEIESSLEHIFGDSGKLKQVLYNYLSNAIKFSSYQGSIGIRASSIDDNTFKLEVSDSGIGIEIAKQNLLFQEFQQLDSSSSKKYQGTGLGLALTKKITEAQGGSVGVSSALGSGSTFFVILPRYLSNSLSDEAQ